MRARIPEGLGRCLSVLALAAIASSGCARVARTGPVPIVSSLIVRNPTAFDVNVYAIAEPAAQPQWLGTIGAGRTGALPVPNSALGATKELTVQARAVGAAATWTSKPLPVLDDQVPLLDIVANSAGNCTGSALYSVTTIDLEMFMR